MPISLPVLPPDVLSQSYPTARRRRVCASQLDMLVQMQRGEHVLRLGVADVILQRGIWFVVRLDAIVQP